MINNFKFKENTGLKFRGGAEKDEKDLKELLGRKKFEIFKTANGDSTTNLTDQQMEDILDDVGKNEGNHDSLILVISSHGEEGVVFGTDHRKDSIMEIKTNKIVQKFMNKNWAGKPKIVIFQACQGDVFDHGVEIEDSFSEGWFDI